MEHRKQVTDVGEKDSGTRQGERRKTGCWSKEDVIGAELAVEKTSITTGRRKTSRCEAEPQNL